MENASKALLIAAGMLLIILVLSFAILLFKRMGSQSSEFYKDMSDTEIYEFNQQFFNYERNDLKIQDVVSVINLAKDANDKERVPVTLEINYLGSVLDLNTVDTKKMLSDSINDDINTRYTCTVEYSGNLNYVGKITITKNTT